MVGTVGSLVAGAVFGLALAAPPGPMNAVIAEESVLRGWDAGFRAGLGAMTADAVFFVLALVGVVAFVERFPTVRGVMVGVGGLLMLYFAYWAAQDIRGSYEPEAVVDGANPGTSRVDGDGGLPERILDKIADGSRSTGFRKAFALALTNPYQILFWLTIGVGLLDSGRVDVLAHTPYLGDALTGALVVETGSPALIVGFFGGIVLWVAGFPLALVQAGRRTDRFAPVVATLSALVLIGFGVAFLWDAATTLA